MRNRANKTGKTRRYWISNEWDRAQRMAEDGASIQEIGAAVNRPFDQVRYKFERERQRSNTTLRPHSEGANSFTKEELEAMQARRESTIRAALDERDRRTEARHRQNLTAAFFGDPPPGYSALDRKQESSPVASA